MSSGFRVPDVDLKAVQQPQALSTFTAPNGTSLDAITPEVGGVWTEQSASWEIQGNKTRITASPGESAATVATSISDGVIDCDVTTGPAASYPGVTLRYANMDNRWHCRLDEAGNEVQIWEVNGGAFIKRASAAVAIAANTTYSIRAIAYSQTIDFFTAGGNKITYGVAALNETMTTHGLYTHATAGDTFDNFAIYARTSPTYDGVLGAA